MADDIDVTPGSGKTVAADERSIGGATVLVQRVTPEGGTDFTTGHVTVTNTATTIIAARETRKYATVVNYQTVPIYVGPATVTTSNGIRLDPGASIDIPTTKLIQGITAAAYTPAGEDDKTHFLEAHD